MAEQQLKITYATMGNIDPALLNSKFDAAVVAKID